VNRSGKYDNVRRTPPAGSGTVVLAAAVERDALAWAIAAALEHLVAAHGVERIEVAWRASFPAKELAQLTQRLA